MKKYDVTLRRRIYGLLGIFILSCLYLMGGAFRHQVLERDRYLSWADQQQLEPVRLVPLRGKILDRRGNPMAVSLKAGSVFVHPALVEDPDAAAKLLSPPLGLKPDRLLSKLKQDVSFTWLARQIPLDKAEGIRRLRLSGVGMEKEGKRYYPNQELAGHVLGFTGVDSQGLEGIEVGFDSYLKGPQGRLFLQRDAQGRVFWQEVPERQASGGCNELELTLDLRIQYVAEQALSEAVRSWQARSGTALVMDPRSGEILALACAPEFDPNRYRKADPSLWKNRAITDSFEPGSTAKVLTVAAALEEGLVEEDTTFDCERGKFRYGGCLLHDMHPHGVLTVREILMFSSNIGVTKIADRLGRHRMWSYFNAYGFGSRSGLDLPGEVTGMLRDEKTWYPIDVATHAFGQGFSVTALQLACAYSAVANGGFLLEPYLVKTVRDKKGEVILERQPSVLRRVFSARTSKRALALMEAVVDGGTGKEARIRGFRVGGKTGTAQKVDPATGRYSDHRSVASFVGILPVENPEMVIVVALDEPQGHATGGRAAAPVFRQIASHSLRYRRVPARISEDREPAAPLRLCSLASPVPGAETRGASVPAGYPFAGSTRWKMPDLRLLPLRSAFRALGEIPVSVRLEGSGTVVFQDPLPGSPLGPGTILFLQALPEAGAQMGPGEARFGSDKGVPSGGQGGSSPTTPRGGVKAKASGNPKG
jgi:cell division protein FtsI (penicillin-binding protein 3)